MKPNPKSPPIPEAQRPTQPEIPLFDIQKKSEAEHRLTPAQLTAIARHKSEGARDLTSTMLLEMNRVVRALGLIRERLAKRYGEAMKANNLKAAEDARLRSTVVRLAARQAHLTNSIGICDPHTTDPEKRKHLEEMVRDLEKINSGLDVAGFNLSAVYAKSIEDGLVTPEEIDNILEGLDSDGTPLIKPSRATWGGR
jgi:hypothetical protein